MAEKKRYTEGECHKRFAVDLFNLVWEFLDKKGRTKEEDDKMVHAAHASRFHWGEIGTGLEMERGEWQISRVYAVLNRPRSALFYAKRCLEICQSNHIGDFDIAFAYEAMARAQAIAGEEADSQRYIQLAKRAGEQIKGKEDREIFFGELNTVPGYSSS